MTITETSDRGVQWRDELGLFLMQCPDCQSTHIRKNGKRRGKQNHISVGCRRQFIDSYTVAQGYSDDIKGQCLRMYVSGMGFRGIERVTGVHHTTVISWVKQVGEYLPDAYGPSAGQGCFKVNVEKLN